MVSLVSQVRLKVFTPTRESLKEEKQNFVFNEVIFSIWLYALVATADFYSGDFWSTWYHYTIKFWWPCLSRWILFLSWFVWKAWVHVYVFMCTHTHTHTLYLAQDKCVSVCVYVSRHAFVCMCITSTSLCRFRFTGPLVDDQSVWKKSTPTNITWN